MSVPLIAIFNAANSALQAAKYDVERELFSEAANEVAVASRMVRILQAYSPDHGRPDPPSTKLPHLMKSLSGVAMMFHYQIERWNIDPKSLDEELFHIDEAS